VIAITAATLDQRRYNGNRQGVQTHRQLPILKGALAAHQAKYTVNPNLERQAVAA